jgi:hypothetical protein
MKSPVNLPFHPGSLSIAKAQMAKLSRSKLLPVEGQFEASFRFQNQLILGQTNP